jgi:hypothetical protein
MISWLAFSLAVIGAFLCARERKVAFKWLGISNLIWVGVGRTFISGHSLHSRRSFSALRSTATAVESRSNVIPSTTRRCKIVGRLD